MDWSWGRAAEIIGTISAFGVLGSIARASMGNWHGLRNPWVIGWLVLMICSWITLGLLTGGMLPLPISERSVVRTVILVVLVLSLTTPFMAVWAGFRHQDRIDRILGISGREDLTHKRGDIEAALIREHVESIRDLDTLRAVQPIIARTGGAPQYPWLTPEWLEDRIEGIRLGRIDRMTG
jgi:hypothetical protein